MAEETPSRVPNAASEAAGNKLTALGFKQDEGGFWVGEIQSDSGESATIRVLLSELFPYALPTVVAKPPKGNPARAHVLASGKLCIAPSNVLLDVERPESIIEDSIKRAKGILFAQSVEANERDLIEEFSAYWGERDVPFVSSVYPTDAPDAPIVLAILKNAPVKSVFASTEEEAKRWADAVGATIVSIKPTYAITLRKPIAPPPLGQPLTLRDLRELLSTNATEEQNASFTQWLKREGVPSYLLIRAPLSIGGHLAFACSLPSPTGEQKQKAQNGFRSGHVPPALLVSHASTEPVSRLELNRLDAAYLVERGGGDIRLFSKRVALIGCGAVGSQIADSLLGSGVGELRIFDNEILTEANVHRHPLGIAHLYQQKATALTKELRKRFPHLLMTDDTENVLTTFANAPEKITECDVVIIALGDETVERRLTELLPGSLRRVHVWLEPLGLGGHALAAGFEGHKGCFECLYRRDETHGLVNMASLVEPGQVFTKIIGGCAGTFTPYGVLDAKQAAIEASRLAINVLLGELIAPFLQSWIVSRQRINEGDFSLSKRASSIEDGSHLSVSDFARADCRLCGGKVGSA